MNDIKLLFNLTSIIIFYSQNIEPKFFQLSLLLFNPNKCGIPNWASLILVTFWLTIFLSLSLMGGVHEHALALLHVYMWYIWACQSPVTSVVHVSVTLWPFFLKGKHGSKADVISPRQQRSFSWKFGRPTEYPIILNLWLVVTQFSLSSTTKHN